MKKLIFTSVFAFLFAAGSMVAAQNQPEEYLGLPGDNLNLYAVMNIFQESETLEAFERSLNDPEAMINNLDLNNDGYVDYIMVYDLQDGNIHNIVLRVALQQDEYQDVAVFVVEKLRDGSVRIQLIGDEALYGPNYIIEPYYAERPNPGYQGSSARPQTTTVVHTTYYEVATWPVIVYISQPVYRPWHSSWYYGYYPSYWHSWNPHYYHYYYGYHYHWHMHYHTYYRPWSRIRSPYYHTVYIANQRYISPKVVTRVEQGRYKDTYSRPEKIQEGQQLFAQRHPGRYEKVASKSNIPAPELRKEPTSVQSVKQRPVEEVRTSGAASERRQENTAGQSSESSRGQSPATHRENRAIQQNNERQQAQPVRSQEPEGNRSRENSSPETKKTPAPARETRPAPQRNVNPSSRERNSSENESKPSRFNNSNNRSSSPAVSSPPARSNKQPSSSVKSSGKSRSKSTPSRSNNSSKKRNSSSENNKRSERR